MFVNEPYGVAVSENRFNETIYTEVSAFDNDLQVKLLMASGPEVIKLFSCSTQLSIKFFLLINVKMPKLLAF